MHSKGNSNKVKVQSINGNIITYVHVSAQDMAHLSVYYVHAYLETNLR